MSVTQCKRSSHSLFIHQIIQAVARYAAANKPINFATAWPDANSLAVPAKARVRAGYSGR
ncbi:hypothetical protein [Vibrio hibernica]|uniref:hypothetical protein n=1 Tax=Vibrio hibernica TaxID=2587465 RepID=UPI00188266BD|nr:hypothetical protein [Vibrio hibernica]